MAKTSGGVRAASSGRGLVGDTRADINIGRTYPLSDIGNEDVHREIKQAISKFHGQLGIKTREVRLADLEPDVLGVAGSTALGPKMVYLQHKFFQNKERVIRDSIRKSYRRGHTTTTNQPLQHVIIHELSHTVWTNHFMTPKHLRAGREIRTLYSEWRRDRKAGFGSKKYGNYAGTNINEFVAETLTKSVIGNSDTYTRRLRAIVKKYKL